MIRRSRASIGVLFLLLCLALSCRDVPGFDDCLRDIISPHEFDGLRWSVTRLMEGDHLLADAIHWQPDDPAACQVVLEYYALIQEVGRARAEMMARGTLLDESPEATDDDRLTSLTTQLDTIRDTVEWILARQVRYVLNREGIYNPLDRFAMIGFAFPPINFDLERLPYTLIVSPRDRIESIREAMLVPDLTWDTIDLLEAQVEELNVSALALEIGGYGGTYPTLVADDTSLRYAVETVAEEWLHQYLAFTPLGFAYVLDLTRIAPDYRIAIMNETAAGIISGEIARVTLETFCAEYAAREYSPREPTRPQDAGRFDFNQAMRETRLTVDAMLAAGQIEEAEKYMEQRRLGIVAEGYWIRRLNQAYFAFYGTYADLPTSVDPIGETMRRLRQNSTSLRDFANTVAAMGSYQDLLAAEAALK